ncbi:MAG: tRNA (N(6)-L-threonylcarbamoyladenosine(37)-C(2))-methylthiotransferase MtaB [Candidatus Gastranaerophilales bacterium]|nr:tRNA (N(6)-L-threonylcarbamoyladenosine(37)-C(2))-methylthiotransferase MtaB [Candidatus Gastranaerophilales bacterium]
MKKVAINTLGCRTNQLESSIIIDDFRLNGWEIVKFSDVADVYIINTCTVTGKSDTNSRYYIRQAKRTNQDAKIIVTGCYAQTSPDELSGLNEVDLIVGNTEKNSLFDLVKAFLFKTSEEKILVSDILQEEEFNDKKVLSAIGRTRANIKIQDGCNYRCSYCIVPYARGKSRSNSLDNILDQVKTITKQGYKELVISGIHLGQWGLDLSPQNSLANLIKEIEKIEELKRFRLSSIDPMEFNDDLIETLINSKKFCRHLHISLQSGNDEILKQMKRRYTVEQYSNLILNLTNNIPNLAVGSDIIVGFPGETDDHFGLTYKNLKNLPITYIHVFSYSRRKGTPADKMPNQVHDHIKKKRNTLLTELAANKNLEFRKSQIGRETEILVELARDKNTGLLKGMTDNFISVLIEGDDRYKNTLTKVVIEDAYAEFTKGKIFK